MNMITMESKLKTQTGLEIIACQYRGVMQALLASSGFKLAVVESDKTAREMKLPKACQL